MKEILEVIGACAVTTVILGIPVLSYMSFIYNWHGFIIMCLLLGLAVDFIYVLNELIGETE